MANIGAPARKQCLDWILGGATPAGITARYIGLAIGVPTYTGASECADAGYTRQTMSFNAGSTYAAGASVSNVIGATFGPFSAAATFSGYHIWDAAAAGNMWWYQTFANVSNLSIGDQLIIQAGNLEADLPAANGIMPYLAKQVLDWMCGGAAATRPAGRWITIASGLPNSVGASDGGWSSSGVATLGATMGWSAAVSPSGTVLNNVAASFRAAAGPITRAASGWNLYDAIGGNRLLFGSVTAAANVNSNSMITLAAGAGIKISLV